MYKKLNKKILTAICLTLALICLFSSVTFADNLSVTLTIPCSTEAIAPTVISGTPYVSFTTTGPAVYYSIYITDFTAGHLTYVTTYKTITSNTIYLPTSEIPKNHVLAVAILVYDSSKSTYVQDIKYMMVI